MTDPCAAPRRCADPKCEHTEPSHPDGKACVVCPHFDRRCASFKEEAP